MAAIFIFPRAFASHSIHVAVKWCSLTTRIPKDAVSIVLLSRQVVEMRQTLLYKMLACDWCTVCLSNGVWSYTHCLAYLIRMLLVSRNIAVIWTIVRLAVSLNRTHVHTKFIVCYIFTRFNDLFHLLLKQLRKRHFVRHLQTWNRRQRA